MKNRVWASIKGYRLTASVSLLLFAVSIYAAVRLLQGELYLESFGYASTSTLILYSAVFIATAALLRSRRLRDVEAFTVALSTTVSAIWSYELIYHYSFPVYFNYFKYPYFDFTDLRTLFIDGSLSSLILAGYRYATFRRNYFFLTSLTLFSSTYALWLLAGFPHPDGSFYLPRIIAVSDPIQLGYILNRASKLFLSTAWVTLYVRRGRLSI